MHKDGQEIYDDVIAEKPVQGIKAFINQFNQTGPMGVHMDPVIPPSILASAPYNKPRANLHGGIQVMPGAGLGISKLSKPVPATKKPVVPPKKALQPPRALKPNVSDLNSVPKTISNENQKLPPSVSPRSKGPELVPRSPKSPLMPIGNKCSTAPHVPVTGVPKTSFSETQNKFNKTPVTNNIFSKSDNNNNENEFGNDQMYYAGGKKYRMLKIKNVSDPPPSKPPLPRNFDIYEFQCQGKDFVK